MQHKTLTAGFLQTISWFHNEVVDWANAGKQYFSDGRTKQLYRDSYGMGFNFDGAITSENGEYAFIYKKLGTKGLLLKNGELLREINRSYYCADAYEYPVAFVTLNDKTYLIHCPVSYKQLDFEDVETGELITNIPGREPFDVFHSRLEISPGNTFLMCKGWQWHPLDVVKIFNINACIENPKLLDLAEFSPYFGSEACTASFIDNQKILVGSSDEETDEEDVRLPSKHIAVWDFVTDELSKPVPVNAEFGNLFAINERFAWDLFDYPKIIDLKTGTVVDQDENFNSGKQRSSMISDSANFPQIVFNRRTGQIAIKGYEKIDILTPDPQFL